MGKNLLIQKVSDERDSKFKRVISQRQDISIILENVHDPHNIGAILRSCDATGVSDIYILDSEKKHIDTIKNIGINAASGSKRWLRIHSYFDIDACFTAVRKKYTKIFGTHLDSESVSLYDLKLTEPICLLFGNEHAGISKEVLQKVDGNFIIPMYGMVQSLNISVACAVSLFEASRQRGSQGLYNLPFTEQKAEHIDLYQMFTKNHIYKI